ncbi:reducing type I polyketide synthase [Lasiodiplodia theobromae]|uniref:Reducing type I polyketide synthase n=1 Tax=Lasiodiplodia theobromae TaxID=45133 RepID=A0A8H7IT65_9PEZI|nr:reducing type I polyketide synthase [Lasiodiplodia theobromae]
MQIQRFLDDTRFDAGFFGLGEALDPQERLELEVAFEALENAGVPLTSEGLAGAAFCGPGNGQHVQTLSRAFGLCRPGSSAGCGLAALQLACQRICSGNVEVALVTAANLVSRDAPSPNGSSPAESDQEQDAAEGAVAIVLKPLEAALRQGDSIRAVVRESASAKGCEACDLEALIRSCYERAGLDPLDTAYVEAQEACGDSVESTAIKAVFGGSNKALSVVSVGSDLGRLQAVSGLAAVVRIIMAFEKGLVSQASAEKRPSRASINGYGGDSPSVHMILEQCDPLLRQQRLFAADSSEPESRVVIPYSAKSENSARRGLSDLSDFVRRKLDSGADLDLRDLALTLSRRRTRFAWTAALSVRSKEELVALLDAGVRPTAARRPPRLGFAFSGDTAHWHAIGRELVAVYPAYAASLEESQRCLRDLGAEWNLFAGSVGQNNPDFIYPLRCALQIALVQLLADWGVRPDAVTSHSSGEIAAAFCAGALNQRDAIAIAFFRGQLVAAAGRSTSVKEGSLTVGLGLEGLQRYLVGPSPLRLSVASINSPSSVTLRGHLRDLSALLSKLAVLGLSVGDLQVGGFHHSGDAHAVAAAYLAVVRQHTGAPAAMNGMLYTSPVTGARIANENSISAEHWMCSLMAPGLFMHALQTMIVGPDAVSALVEIGPANSLAGFVKQSIEGINSPDIHVSYASCLSVRRSGVETMQALACFLHTKGIPVDFERVNASRGRCAARLLHDLPPYPWDHGSAELLGIPSFVKTIPAPELHTWTFPLGAPLLMAIEAMRELYQTRGVPVAGFELRDVELLQPPCPHALSGEVQVTLWPQSVCARHVFKVRLCTPGRETREYLRGYIAMRKPPDGSRSDSRPVEVGGDRSPVEMRIVSFTPSMLAAAQRQLSIHPATIEEAIQLACSRVMTFAGDGAAEVPSFIEKMSIGCPLGGLQGRLLRGCVLVRSQGTRGYEASIELGENDDDDALLCIRNAHFPPAPKAAPRRKAVHPVTWVSSLAATSSQGLQYLLWLPPNEHDIARIGNLTRAAYHIICDTLDQLTPDEIGRMPWHSRSLVHWMKGVVHQASCDALAATSSEWARTDNVAKEMIFKRAACSCVDGELLTRLGASLAGILSGHVDPISILVEDGLLTRYYSQSLRGQRTASQVQRVLQLFAVQTPGARILEIGAGTGALTRVCLPSLDARVHYDFTDICPELFSMTREQLGPVAASLAFRTLDIEADLAQQSFEPASYDLIIANQSLHTVHDLDAAMQNVRKLLKPGGRLLAVETTRPTPDIKLTFGILPNWWLSKEQERRDCPMMSLNAWENTLRFHGFSGLDFHTHDFDDFSLRSATVMLSTAIGSRAFRYWPFCSIIHVGSSAPPAWLQQLAVRIEELTGYLPAVELLEPRFNAASKVCLFVGALEEGVGEATAATVADFVGTSKGLLWLSHGGATITPPSGHDGDQFLSHAKLLRSCSRSSDSSASKRIVALDIDPEDPPWSPESIETIARIYSIAFDYEVPGPIDDEFVQRGLQVLVPRIPPGSSDVAGSRD